MDIIINQISIFALLLVVGYIAAKTHVITRESLAHLSKLIVKIILPALIFSIVSKSSLDSSNLHDCIFFAILVILMFAILLIMGIIISKSINSESKTKNIHIALSTFGNMGFMGIPLINEIFKVPEAKIAITLYTIVDMALLWTLGVYLCSRHRSDSHPLSAAKNMINPTTLSLFIALITASFNINIPNVVSHTVDGIGSTSKYLTLIYLGASMPYVSFTLSIKRLSIWLLTFTKMLIAPIIIYYISIVFLPTIYIRILVLVTGLPAMTTIVMLAKSYDSDDEYATEVIFITTIMSLITIPLVNILIDSL